MRRIKRSSVKLVQIRYAHTHAHIHTHTRIHTRTHTHVTYAIHSTTQVEQLVEAAAPTLVYAVDHITMEKCSDTYNKKCSDASRKQ